MIDGRGLVLTNAHVVDQVTTVNVTLSDGEQRDGAGGQGLESQVEVSGAGLGLGWPHQTHGGVGGAPLAHQDVDVGVSDLLHEAPVVVMKVAAILGHSYSGDPLVQLFLRVDTQISDVLGILGLDLRVLDSETEVSGGFKFTFPSHPVVNLVHVKCTKAQEIL